MRARVPVTAGGKIRLMEEVARLKSVERPQIVREIETARSHGDLSENAEYHAAKERQGQIEGRIRYLEDLLSRVEVVDTSRLDAAKVVFGVAVKLHEAARDRQFRYRIVGEVEADIEKGLLSVTSPMGKALIGKEVGDTVVVQVPGGTREFEVVEITLE